MIAANRSWFADVYSVDLTEQFQGEFLAERANQHLK
jgi:hypothetical protein